jgi:hypothetical protein
MHKYILDVYIIGSSVDHTAVHMVGFTKTDCLWFFTFDRHSNRYVHLNNFQLEITQQVNDVLLIHWMELIRQHRSHYALVSVHNKLCHNSMTV